jgi:putative Holliday junction resolvase
VRALGLDVGDKTIGVALSDELGLAAHPLVTLTRHGTQRDVAEIAQLVREHSAAAVVVGLPLELSGQVGARARRVRTLMDALRGAVDAGVAIHEWDERFSTVAVERVLIDADLSRRRRKAVIDKQAAAFILQGWLDSGA